MFTGLVEDIGYVERTVSRAGGTEIEIRTSLPMTEISQGESIAVNGTCLTVESMSAKSFVVFAGEETLSATNIGLLRVGVGVHLERALTLAQRLGGHIVQGHVDTVGTVVRSTIAQGVLTLEVRVPRALTRYMVPKGSITVDGVSLTIHQLTTDIVSLSIIPHTIEATCLAQLKPSAKVNIEVDVLAKYVESLLEHDKSNSALRALLKR